MAEVHQIFASKLEALVRSCIENNSALLSYNQEETANRIRHICDNVNSKIKNERINLESVNNIYDDTEMVSMKIKKDHLAQFTFNHANSIMLANLLTSSFMEVSEKKGALLFFLSRMLNFKHELTLYQLNCHLNREISGFPHLPKPSAKPSSTGIFYFELYKKTFASRHICGSDDLFMLEVFSCLSGFNGNYFIWDVKSARFFIPSDKANVLPPLVASLLMKLTEIANLFMRINTFVLASTTNIHKGSRVPESFVASHQESSGYHLIIQRLSAYLSCVKEEYLTFLNELSFNYKSRSTTFTLFSLYQELQKYRTPFIFFCDVIGLFEQELLCAKANQNSLYCKFLNILYEQAAKNSIGDTELNNLAVKLFSYCATDYFEVFMSKWLSKGVVDLAEGGFFIQQTQKSTIDYWFEKFVIQPTLVPLFIGSDLADKICFVGKSVRLAQDLKLDLAHKISSIFEKFNFPNSLFLDHYFIQKTFPEIVEQLFRNIGNELIQSFVADLHILDHFYGIRDFLLLRRGDFSSLLISRLFDSLSKTANMIFKHHLIGVLDDSIKASCVRQIVGRRLDVRLFEVFDGDLGWDLFCLDYRFSFPENVVFSKEIMSKYYRIFAFLWKLYRALYIVQSKLLNASFLEIRRLTHFVSTLYNYFQLVVIESPFVRLMESLHKAVYFEELLQQHSDFVESVLNEVLFISSDSKLHNVLIDCLDSIFFAVPERHFSTPRKNPTISLEKVFSNVEVFIEGVKMHSALILLSQELQEYHFVASLLENSK